MDHLIMMGISRNTGSRIKIRDIKIIMNNNFKVLVVEIIFFRVFVALGIP